MTKEDSGGPLIWWKSPLAACMALAWMNWTEPRGIIGGFAALPWSHWPIELFLAALGWAFWTGACIVLVELLAVVGLLLLAVGARGHAAVRGR